MTTPTTPAEKVAFFKENGYWFKTSMVKKALKPAYFKNNGLQEGQGMQFGKVEFSIPYAESNHAKAVAYFGREKMQKFKNNL